MTRRTLQAATLVVLLGAGATAHAAGFALIEQSVKGLGNAYAGAAATAEDPSTVFFNPAGLSRLKGQQVLIGAEAIKPQARFDDDGSKTGNSTNDSGDAGSLGVVPNVYYSAEISDVFSAGVGIFSPFGLTTEYDDDWIGRYYAVKSQLKTLDFNPTVSMKVAPNWSVGIGLNLQWLDAELSQMSNYGAKTTDPRKWYNTAYDGKSKVTGSSWGWGFNVGTLLDLTPDTRLGVAYRSRVEHHVNGNLTNENAPAGIPARASADVDITLPDSASLSLYHRFNPQWAVMADATWTHWSVFESLDIRVNNNPSTKIPTTYNWRDTWRYSLGTTFTPTDRLALRAGVAYDQTPIREDSYRTPRIPDNDRFWVALGGSYRFASWIGLDVGYAHLFVKDSNSNKLDPALNKGVGQAENAGKGNLLGTYETSVDIVSAQVSMTF